MNAIGLATIAVILCGGLLSPVLLLWGGYCLTRQHRRAEGFSILGFGILTAAFLIVAGALTAPPDSPGLFRVQALIIVAGAFGLGAAAGKALHLARTIHEEQDCPVRSVDVGRW